MFALLIELVLPNEVVLLMTGVLLLIAEAETVEIVAEEFDATAYDASNSTNESDHGAILEDPNGEGISS
jgi:hypothetical protein